MLAKTRNFFEEVRVELEKVTWPVRKETMATTWVVVFIVVLISFYLGACDLLMSKIIRFLLN